MSSTTVKHQNFIQEPMGEKEVTKLAGIGTAFGEELVNRGFDKAYVVLGQFLVLKKDEEKFIDWLEDLIGADRRNSSACYNCLQAWSDAFL